MDKVREHKRRYREGNQKVKDYHDDYNKKYYHAKKKAWHEFLERQFKDQFEKEYQHGYEYEKDERLFIDRLKIEFKQLYSYEG